MLASTTTVAYASEIENQSLIETEKNADQVTLTDPSSDAAVLEDDGENYQGDLSENVNSQSSHDVQQNQDDSISASDGTLTGDNAPLQNSENQPESNTSQEENEETDAPVEEQHEGWVDTEEGKKYYVANTYDRTNSITMITMVKCIMDGCLWTVKSIIFIRYWASC